MENAEDRLEQRKMQFARARLRTMLSSMFKDNGAVANEGELGLFDAIVESTKEFRNTP